MAKLIYIQHTDISYDSLSLSLFIDFDDPISTLSYSKKIYQTVSRVSEEAIDQTFKTMRGIFTEDTENGSKPTAEVQAQHIMRSAVDKIHDAFEN